ncbi:MAG: NUDIX domain-containing protein [Patescibacteria group bacterium]
MENTFCAGIHILVKKDNLYLLLKRAEIDQEDPGCWDLPGGGINYGEQPFAAASREAKEEASIEIKVTKLLALWAMPYRGKWSLEILVVGDYVTGEVTVSWEHTNFRWVTPEELKTIFPRSVHLEHIQLD